jgi:biopolymer transport protein ExbD
MAVSTAAGDDDVMSTINITPFTDVLLVLLIIFIILASVTKEPHMSPAHNKDKVKDSQIIVYISDKNAIQIGATTTDISGAPELFHTLQDQTNHIYTSVIIKADPNASYGVILQVMDAAKKENLTNFGLANKTCPGFTDCKQ